MIASKFSQLAARHFGPRHGKGRRGGSRQHGSRHGAFDHHESHHLHARHLEEQEQVADGSCMPLALVTPGDTVAIHSFRGGRKLRQRLLDLGLNHGARVRVLKNDMPGPLIVAVKEDGRLALGRGMTQQIFVTHLDPNIVSPAGASQHDS